MNFESLRQYLLGKPGASEEFPFGPSAMVFKVRGKMFALIAVQETPMRLNLKCDPELALHLRAMYEAVKPGYHMNKKHWNTVTIDGTLPDEEIITMINDSYDLVVKGLPQGDRKSMGV